MYTLGAGPGSGAARACRGARPQASSSTSSSSSSALFPALPWRRRRPLPLAPPPRAAPPDSSPPLSTATTTTATTTTTTTPPPVPVPKSIFDVDNGRILGFGPDLAPDHPGFGDGAYARRRAAIARLALSHVPGTPPPLVDYLPEELATWRAVLARLTAPDMLPCRACREYLSSLGRLGFSGERVPQLRDVDAILEKEAGWRVRPVAGLMHPRDFLAGLAFRTFHSTQYCRHGSQPQYTPEPDVVHELVGHVPMLLVPAYARMAEAVGRASLGASEAQLWHLVKVYWYSVEFGVVWEEQEQAGGGAGKALKAFGAGILSSSAEMAWLGKGGGYDVRPLDPRRPLPRMSYKDGVQRAYYSLESFDQGAALLDAYAREGAPAPANRTARAEGAGGGGGGGEERRSAR